MKYIHREKIPFFMFHPDLHHADTVWVKSHNYWIYSDRVYKEIGADESLVRGVRCCGSLEQGHDPWDYEPDYNESIVFAKNEASHVGYYPVDLTQGWWRWGDEGVEYWEDDDIWVPIVEIERSLRRAQMEDLQDQIKWSLNDLAPVGKGGNPLKIPNPDGDPLVQRLIIEGRAHMMGNYQYVACIRGIHRGKLFVMEGNGRRGWIRGSVVYSPSKNKKNICGESAWNVPMNRRSLVDLSLDNCVIVTK